MCALEIVPNGVNFLFGGVSCVVVVCSFWCSVAFWFVLVCGGCFSVVLSALSFCPFGSCGLGFCGSGSVVGWVVGLVGSASACLLGCPLSGLVAVCPFPSPCCWLGLCACCPLVLSVCCGGSPCCGGCRFWCCFFCVVSASADTSQIKIQKTIFLQRRFSK